MLAWRKEMSIAIPPIPQPYQEPVDEFDIVQAREVYLAAQNCTKPQPIRVAPQPGRNELCSCGSGIKYKRCCLSKAA
jgi:uncharacterized protein YecA (UPF0149 family)